MMRYHTVTFDLPANFVNHLGSVDEVAAQAKQAFILQLLREARISQGKAAELLDITRYDILDLMARHEIPMGPRAIEEIDREIETARRLAKERRQDNAG